MNVDRFIMKYLGHDGVFILRMIAQFADVVFSTELIGALWRSHCAIEHERRALKMVDRVWPQHEQRLKAALFEEELAADTADDYKGSVTHLRRKSIPFLQSNTSSSFSPRVADSDSTLRDMIGKANINLNRKESIFSLGQISPPPALSLKHGGLVRTNSSRLRRRRSLEDLRSLSLKRVKKFADSSSDEDENTKKSTASRKGSIFKLS
ncbi:hypothetical protein AB6A40_000949 [Gnathostoma spinigerum]|uniref:Uncharacterized protein n=1 Tax=Gnathostoma spinigerum TaxID=75299 RepID=A0ABD6E336_9BILA